MSLSKECIEAVQAFLRDNIFHDVYYIPERETWVVISEDGDVRGLDQLCTDCIDAVIHGFNAGKGASQ